MSFEKKIEFRLKIILFLFCCFVLLLIINLSKMMLFSNLNEPEEDTLLERLTKEEKKKTAKLPLNIIKPKEISSITLPRGMIYARNLEKLAFSVKKKILVLDKRKVIEDKGAVAILSEILNTTYEELNKKFHSTNRNWIELVDDLDDEKLLDEIRRRLKKYENAFAFQTKYKRVYPHKNFLSHIIGYVSRDNRGLYGIEAAADDVLSGRNAKNKIFQEPIGILFYDKKILSSFSGSNVVLTIDFNIQQIVEQELDLIQSYYHPKSITCIVMRPKTGEILALANRPDFDPNEVNKITDPEVLRNYAISDWYEPGSTQKIVTAALLVNEDLVDDSKIINCPGRYKIYEHTYHCFNKVTHGDQTFAQVIANSCNIGIIKLVANVPKNLIYKYLLNFGYGITTGLGLIGKRAETVKPPERWSGLSKYSISIGQEITVTALQLINSLMVIPNGGALLQPRLIKEIRDDNNNVVISNDTPIIIRQAISEKTAKRVSRYLMEVIESGGTGQKAKIKGIAVAGKTGTAQTIDQQTGGYSKEDSIASFFGYFPEDKPEYAILVIVNQAGKGASGGLTAAPAFKNIAVRILEYKENYPVSDIKTAKVAPIYENDDYIEINKRENALKNKNTVDIRLDREKNHLMPDLTGKSKRECLNILSEILKEYNINLKIEGAGYLYYQSIKPNNIIKKEQTLILKFRG